MSIKLIAMGNVLMEDDAAAVFIADILKEELGNMGIETVYGETDTGYSISRIEDGDFLIVMDAASLGREPGEVTVLPFDEIIMSRRQNTSQHDIGFLELLRLYYPENDGIIVTIQIAEIGLCYGLSPQLRDKIEAISEEVRNCIMKTISK